MSPAVIIIIIIIITIIIIIIIIIIIMLFWVFHFTSNVGFFRNPYLLPSKYFSILCFYTAMMMTMMISVIITKMGSLQVTLLVFGQHGEFRPLISCPSLLLRF